MNIFVVDMIKVSFLFLKGGGFCLGEKRNFFELGEFLDNNDCFAYHRMRLRSDDGDIEKINIHTHQPIKCK